MKALRCGSLHSRHPRKNPCSGYIFEALVSLVKQMPEVFINAKIDYQAFIIYSQIYVIRVDKETGSVSVVRVTQLENEPNPATDNSTQITINTSTKKTKATPEKSEKPKDTTKPDTDTKLKQELEAKAGLEQLG